MPNQWIRSTAYHGPICPICGHKGGCLLAVDALAVVCIRVQEGCAKRKDGSEVRVAGNMGWVHRLNGTQNADPIPRNRSKVPSTPKSVSSDEWQALQGQLVAALSEERLSNLANELGLSIRSMRAYGIGWHDDTGTYSFPMYDGMRSRQNGFAISGIRLRSRDGKFKSAVKGTRNGIFIPTDYRVPDMADPPMLLMVPEGPTDAITARDCGFRAIGLPSCLSGGEQLRNLVSYGQRQHIIIFADRDETKWLKDKEGNKTTPFWPGYEGALGLADTIGPYAESVRIIQPPKGIKDLRDWIKQTGNAFLVQALAFSAPTLSKSAIRERKAEVEKYRKIIPRT